MATEPDDESMAVRLAADQVVRLLVDEKHLSPGEHYDLRLAAYLAASEGQVTWLIDLGGNITAAIVPAGLAAQMLGMECP
jgi:hypothetical protein